jgi:hypothetical protein
MMPSITTSTARGCVAAACLALVACQAPTEACAPPALISGSWRYAAEQQAPEAAQLTGTLVITGQRCADLDGTLDVMLVDARGESRRVAGRVTGQMLDATAIRFDALIGAVPRQHLATLRGDSLTGSWLELSGAAGGATGQFRAKRGGS